MCNFQDSKQKVRHCKYCGARLKEEISEYCDRDCRIKGQRLWIREQRRRRRWLSNPIGRMVLQVENYNKAHNTNYSYGQFVALCLPKIIKEGTV
ncbi:MAG: hypothetical protein IJZ75_02015 [Clostridia bacterium]|nr:hypothetical protein [Clostridia bacterium]